MASKKWEDKAQSALQEVRNQMTQTLLPEKKQTERDVVVRPTALTFENAEKLKRIIYQDVTKQNNQSYTQYTKSRVKQYFLNPSSYRLQLVGVSRFLWRISTLYRKIIIYYATMPLYNYNIVQKMEFTKKVNAKKLTKDYEAILKRLQKFNFRNEFANVLALAIRDGVYCGYVNDFEEDGMFLQMLPVEYYKIVGKNMAGQWVVAFDMNYFSQGNNIIYVEGINGDVSGCWDEVWIQAWKDYQNDKQNNRWFVIPSEKTITLLSGMEDEYDNPLPFFTGIFTDLLEIIDYNQLLADRTALENYKLLLLGIPIGDGDLVNDFKIDLDYAEAYMSRIDSISPMQVGVGLLPGLSVETVEFNQDTTANTSDIVSTSIKNLFKTVGVSEVVVSSGDANSASGITNSIANDSAYTFLLIKRLEANFQYYIDMNINDSFIFTILRQTWYNEKEFIDNYRQGATLGSSALFFLESQGFTPYEAYNQLLFENAIGIKDIMIPLQSSYNTSQTGGTTSNPNGAGRKRVDDDEISESGERTRNIVDE